MFEFRKAVSVIGTASAIFVASSAIAVGAEGPAVDQGPPTEAAVNTYQKVFPQMSGDTARAAAAGEEARKQIVADLSAKNVDTYGGAWFDPPSGVLHVAATSAMTEAKAQRLGRDLGVAVQTHAVRRSLADLEARATLIRTGNDSLSKAAASQVGIDIQTNRVVAAVKPGRRSAVRSSDVPQSVAVVNDPQLRTEADAGCTSRAACDWTIRAGAMIWRGSSASRACSVGFTARTSGNQRYVYTAGHCSNGNGVTWGTGGLAMGPMQASINSGVLDAAIVRVTNGWFTGDSGGEIYTDSAAGKTVNLNGVAPSVNYMVQGERVCLSANFTSPNGPNLCGVIGAVSDSSVRGMTRVDGLDACPGDSGGGWYWLTSQSRRIAYGIHSRSDTGCHVNGGRSWYTPIAAAKNNWATSLNVEVKP